MVSDYDASVSINIKLNSEGFAEVTDLSFTTNHKYREYAGSWSISLGTNYLPLEWSDKKSVVWSEFEKNGLHISPFSYVVTTDDGTSSFGLKDDSDNFIKIHLEFE